MSVGRVWMSGLAVCLAILTTELPAFAQSGSIPRTANGHPDFQGNWTNRWNTPLERPPATTKLELSPEEAKQFFAQVLSSRRGESSETSVRDPNAGIDITGLVTIGGMGRSSLVVDPADGRIPWTQKARERLSGFATFGNAGDEGPERRGATERCIGANAGLAPFMPMPSGNIRQIVQTRDHIAVLTESFHQFRVIPFDAYGAPMARGGSSSAKWEDDTLVVHTKGFAEGDIVRGGISGMFLSTPRTEITERFIRIGPDEILYRFTVEDPGLYTHPWTAESLLKRTYERMYEVACHEGNYSMTNILQAARMAEARLAGK